MPRLSLPTAWPAPLAPLRAGLIRAALEGMIGCTIILGIVVATDPQYQATDLATALSNLATLWICGWPAWRLRDIRRHRWWRNALLGGGRALLVGVALGAFASVLSYLVWPPAARLFRQVPYLWFVNIAEAMLFFFIARTIVVIVALLLRRARRRLRWQLTASHLAVIVATFIAMTAVGSVLAINLYIVAVRTDARTTAGAVAHLLTLSGVAEPVDRRRVQSFFAEIQDGRLPVRGESPLALLLPRTVTPIRVMLLTPSGEVLAATMDTTTARMMGLPRATTPLPPGVWNQLRTAALAGHNGGASQSVTLYTPYGQTVTERGIFGAAPLNGPGQRPAAVVVLEFLDATSLTPVQFATNLITVFGVATLLLFLAMSLPVLGLATLFGYLLAHGLTRRLEAVSRVTMAIAAGNFTRRAPVNTENEVGRLAEDVNRMAAHLETAMGELQKARKQAEDALRARQELAASVSHELRTPLAVVQAHLDTLALRHASSASASGPGADIAMPESTLHALQHETERLAGLIDDLFSLSRAETGVMQVQCAPVDVAALVQEVAALLRPLAQSEGKIALSVETWPGLPPALADADRLRQIISNLVRNAVRYTPEGGIIGLSVVVEGAWIVVSVADTGSGIPPEHLPHVFDRFYRVDEARTRSSGGAGLGLAIVREFVELMGGHVTVESTVGEGSCFKVYLPVVPSTPATVPLDNYAGAAKV